MHIVNRRVVLMMESILKTMNCQECKQLLNNFCQLLHGLPFTTLRTGDLLD